MQKQISAFKIILWMLILTCLSGTVVLNHMLSDIALIIRILLVSTGLVLSLYFFFKTDLGQQSARFISEARTEVKKVIWPTKKETMQSAIMVFVMVLVVGMFLWTVDAVLFKVVAKITGYGGS